MDINMGSISLFPFFPLLLCQTKTELLSYHITFGTDKPSDREYLLIPSLYTLNQLLAIRIMACSCGANCACNGPKSCSCSNNQCNCQNCGVRLLFLSSLNEVWLMASTEIKRWSTLQPAEHSIPSWTLIDGRRNWLRLRGRDGSVVCHLWRLGIWKWEEELFCGPLIIVT